MQPYEIVTTALGIALALSILLLIRRDHMHVRYSLWWLMVATVAIVFGAFPRLFDELGYAVGVAYPPTLLLVLAVGALLLKMLLVDIERSRAHRKLLRLTQRLVILEQRLRELGEQGGSATGGERKER